MTFLAVLWQGSAFKELLGPEPAFGISETVSKQAIRDSQVHSLCIHKTMILSVSLGLHCISVGTGAKYVQCDQA
jgi:hypothetical protein